MLNVIKIVAGTVFVLTRIILGLGGAATVVLFLLALLHLISWNIFWAVVFGLVVTFVVCVISFAIEAISER